MTTEEIIAYLDTLSQEIMALNAKVRDVRWLLLESLDDGS